VPAAFEAIILQAMAKDPAERYPGAEELRADLLRYRQGRAVVAAPPLPTQAVAATTVQQAVGERTRMVSATEVSTGPAATPRRTGAYVALLFVMLAALVVLLFLLGKTLGIFGGEAGTELVEVPNVVTKTADDAERQLRDLGFDVQRQLENNQASANTVFAQTPTAGEKVDEGSLITLKVSQGEPEVKVPSVVGDSIDDAMDELRAAGFQVTQTSQADRQAPAGRVLSQSPTGGEEAARGATVRLVVSSGKPKVTVPSVTGKDESAARDDIVNAGLKVRTVKEASSTIDAGKVIRSDPTGGADVDEGSTVTIFVSSGPEQADVPNVIGMTQEEAVRAIRAAGFQERVQTEPVTSEADHNRVIDQDPDGGTKRDKGSVVTITVGKKVGP
jgi:serine/threonine-protein kinase